MSVFSTQHPWSVEDRTRDALTIQPGFGKNTARSSPASSSTYSFNAAVTLRRRRGSCRTITSRGSSAVISGAPISGSTGPTIIAERPIVSVALSTSMWSASKLFACQIRHASASPDSSASAPVRNPIGSISSRVASTITRARLSREICMSRWYDSRTCRPAWTGMPLTPR